MVLFSSFNTSIRVNSASFKILSQPSKKVLSVTPIHGIFSICTLLVQFVVIDTHLKRVRDVDIEGHFFRKNGMSFYHVLYHYSTSKTFSNS